MARAGENPFKLFSLPIEYAFVPVVAVDDDETFSCFVCSNCRKRKMSLCESFPST